MSDPVVQFTPDWLILTPRGISTRESIAALIAEHYPNLGGRFVLWDFSHADVSQITREDIDAVAAVAFMVLKPTGSRKVAYVVADAAAYVKACKYFNAAVAAGLPAEYAVFTTRAAAETWLRAR